MFYKQNFNLNGISFDYKRATNCIYHVLCTKHLLSLVYLSFGWTICFAVDLFCSNTLFDVIQTYIFWLLT